MKKRTVGILLGMMMAAASLAGCGGNEATEAANESAEIEKEGSGEDIEEEEAEQETEEAEETKDSNSDGEEEEEPAWKVGVLLPDEQDDICALDGLELKNNLEENGYEAEVVYAQGDSASQISQIQDMMEKEVAAMIISPVNEYGLTEILAQVKELGIPVFSYDKLIRDSDGVSYYTTFSGRQAGRMIGETIAEAKELDKAREAQEPQTIEFLMGSLDDVQALFFYNGVMEILQPYLDDGTLVCSSGRTSFEDSGILRWGRERSEAAMEEILEEFYQETGTPDIICTGFDDAACGAVDALESAGFFAGDEDWPLITGSGCTAEAVTYIAENKIYGSVFMDRRNLAKECVKMVNTYLDGENPEVNNYEEYDNGVKIIGTYTCDLQFINEGNYELLIDNGYYSEEEVRPEVSPTAVPTPENKEEPEVTGIPASENEDISRERQISQPEEEEEDDSESPIMSILGEAKKAL